MNIVKTISKKDYKNNLKRNVLAICSIALTTFMITMVFSLGKSYWDGLTKRSIMMQGALYDVQLPEPTAKQIELSKESDLVKDSGAVLKCAIMNKYNGTNCEETHFYWCDSTAWNKQFVPAFEFVKGHYPTKENEIMLSDKVVKALGIKKPKIGMSLKGIVFDKLSNQGGTKEQDMVLSGIFKDYSGEMKGFVSKKFADATGAKLTDLTQGLLNINLKNHIYSKRDISTLGRQLSLKGNQVIYADLDLKANFIKMALGLILFLFIILVSGYLFIYNVIYISVGRKVQLFGQIKALGLTTHQVRECVVYQMLFNLFIGVLAGLIGGGLIALIIMPIAMKMMNVSTIGNTKFFQPVIMLGAIIFSSMVVLISNHNIIKLVNRISPVTAMKYSHLNKYEKKFSPGKGRMIDMVRKNIFRDKKQAIIVFCSLSLALVTYLTMNVIIEQNSAENVLNATYSYDYRILNQTLSTDNPKNEIGAQMVKRIEKLKGVGKVWRVYSTKIVMPYDENPLDSYYKELYKSPVSTGNYDEDMQLFKKHPENNQFLGNLVGIGDSEFDYINKKLGDKIDKSEFQRGDVAIIKGAIGITPKDAMGQDIKFSTLGNTSKEYAIKIVADYSQYSGPNYFAAGIAPDIIVSSSFMNHILQTPVMELLDIVYKAPFNTQLEKRINTIVGKNENLTTDSKLSDFNELKHTENQLRLLGWLLCSILAAIALINYGNMIAAGIENRRTEFAILRSIGMTPKQLIMMLMYEGFGYGIISIIIAGIVGIPLSYGIFSVLNKYKLSFKVPIIPNVAAFVAILLVCLVIPIIQYRITPSKSIVEVLREE